MRASLITEVSMKNPWTVRDSQRGKVYKAERVIRTANAQKFESIEEIQKYCDRITRSAHWRKLFEANGRFMMEGRYVVVSPKHHGRATGGDSWKIKYRSKRRKMTPIGGIELPKWAWNVPVVLHELAHVAASGKHGRMFARTYLALVRRWMGKDAGKLLLASFRKHRVRYMNKRKLTEAQRSALRIRGQALAAARREKMHAKDVAEQLTNLIGHPPVSVGGVPTGPVATFPGEWPSPRRRNRRS